MGETHHHRENSGGVEAILLLENAEGLELPGDLFAERIGWDDDQQAFKPLMGVQRQHRLRFSGACRHDDGGGFARPCSMGERGVKRADLGSA